MRKFTAGLFMAAAMMTATVAQAADPIVIKFSHVVAENTPKGQMANKFRDLIAERLGGKVVVEVYPSSQLYGDNKVLEAMLLGDVQLAAPSLSKFKKYTKKLQLFDLPFLFKDMAAAEKFQQSEAGQKLLGSMKKKGIVGLGYLHNGMKQLSSSTPLRVPADAKGQKFRIMSSDVLSAQFEALDAVPLKKPFSEVFTLLQTKAIDGQENTWSNIYSKKFFEVQEYITASDHGLLDYLVVTSREFWDGLPDDVRPVVKKSLDEALAFGNNIAAEKAMSDRKAIEASGRSKVIDLTDAERQQWVEAMKPVWAKFEDAVGKDLLDAAIAANN
ncbi:MAG: TRAP transporter substrate-binding protein [Methylocystaceae bacterium]|nr:TRAP transporter substrate-binding protein [Methylocystaceae bacterium]